MAPPCAAHLGRHLRVARWLLLLFLPTSGGQDAAWWNTLILNIARSSLLNTRPGSTVERDVQALIFFFNNTCTASQADPSDIFNPYRGAFAQVSQWREQKGWRSIVQAHSNVVVQCRALYMEGGEEFIAKHCFWNIQSMPWNPINNGTVYPSPQWTIVEDCCELLQRPVLRVNDAVWATTRGTDHPPTDPPTMPHPRCLASLCLAPLPNPSTTPPRAPH